MRRRLNLFCQKPLVSCSDFRTKAYSRACGREQETASSRKPTLQERKEDLATMFIVTPDKIEITIRA